jgi:hypothetical protein
METMKHASHPRPVLTQTQNNTTIWIGHLQNDPVDHFAGQTFKCPNDGQLDNIQLYSAAVQYPGEIQLTLHEFDEKSKLWGSSIGNSTVVFQKTDSSRWILFHFAPVQLKKDKIYGFRLQTKDAFIAFGEAASGSRQPFTFGFEWHGDSNDKAGHFFSYFSLTFKVEMVA